MNRRLRFDAKVIHETAAKRLLFTAFRAHYVAPERTW
jgi:hypothetical protein